MQLDTGGIAAGAELVHAALVQERDARNVAIPVLRTGSVGFSFADPVVEIQCAGMPRTHYGRVTAELAARLIDEHVVGHRLVDDYVIATRQPALALDGPVTHVLVRDSGEVVVVDWGQTGAGAAWMDPLLARLDRAQDPWFDDSVRTTRSPALAALPEQDVTAFLTGLGVLLAVRAVTHADVGPPGLQGFRLAESQRLLRGSVRRLG